MVVVGGGVAGLVAARDLAAAGRDVLLLEGDQAALDEFVVDGIDTTLPLFRTLVRTKDIALGEYDIHWLEHFLAETMKS